MIAEKCRHSAMEAANQVDATFFKRTPNDVRGRAEFRERVGVSILLEQLIAAVRAAVVRSYTSSSISAMSFHLGAMRGGLQASEFLDHPATSSGCAATRPLGDGRIDLRGPPQYHATTVRYEEESGAFAHR